MSELLELIWTCFNPVACETYHERSSYAYERTPHLNSFRCFKSGILKEHGGYDIVITHMVKPYVTCRFPWYDQLLVRIAMTMENLRLDL